MTLPQITDEQRKDALKKAAIARKVRADFKKAVKNGEISPNNILSMAFEQPHLQRMKVYDLLRSLPGVSDTKAKLIMNKLEFPPSKRVIGLGVRQIEQLNEVIAKTRKKMTK